MKLNLVFIISIIISQTKSINDPSMNFIKVDIDHNTLTVNKTLNDSIITNITLSAIRTIDYKIDSLSKLIENYEKISNLSNTNKTISNIVNVKYIIIKHNDDNIVSTYTIFEEMERNVDERNRSYVLKM
jgi:hypothetical protein